MLDEVVVLKMLKNFLGLQGISSGDQVPSLCSRIRFSQVEKELNSL